jgi:amino acid transporter
VSIVVKCTRLFLICLNPDGLAAAGNAPKIFLKTSKKGLPYVSIIYCSVFALLAYMGVNTGAGKVFGWFANMTSVAGLMTWFGICLTYLRFYKGMKLQGYDRSKLPFASPLQPFAAWYAMIFCLVICFVSPHTPSYFWPFLTPGILQFSGWKVFLKGHWDHPTFITNYLPLALFPVLYTGAKLYKRSPIVKTHEMDFVTNIAEIEADT